ncbi:insulinase family protein [Fastidiosipila sanguinis]|uniref:Peptidase M16C associated domain-containing protein n=1 Tax=Fastidiosipila sanguinis TaxID=236753 RepID=A0A2S0KMQ8_9FIRM|nr:insulinase family protein [Fastidiosipila sanguinis]AVM42315.1 hypothetical protein C5Q98_03315 [Fastidiosipila sanguinis]
MNKFGFTLLKHEKIDELNIESFQFIHDKSGAELLYLKAKDDNKAFGVGFKTPPYDDTGLPHILEHAVLAGSRKYKTKEPFMNLVQSSMATYLNASTYPDKTIYPIASRNIQDFRNLMDVYLDAVFYPAIYDEEKIFRQEGWRYDIANVEDPIEYKGVVFSEMRGVYSSPISLIDKELDRALFPDTPYKYESGGDPYTIYDLEIEDYLNFHKKYYHPANSKMYLYGDLDIDEFLQYIDTEYLSNFDKIEIDTEIPIQPKFNNSVEKNIEISIGKAEDPQDKNYAAWGVAFNTFVDYEENAMINILLDTLFNSQSAPVRLAVEAENLGEDYFAYSDCNQENAVKVYLVNASLENANKFSELIEKTLEKVVEEKIDRTALQASINRLEFNLKEMNTGSNTGVNYFSRVLKSWLYGDDPINSLRYADLLKHLNESLESDVWENLVKSKFLDNKHKVSMLAKAIPGLNAEKDAEVSSELAEYKASLSEEDLENLVNKNQELYKWQEQDDSPEKKATIPTLNIEDIEVDVPKLNYDIEEHDNYTVIENHVVTSGVNYVIYSFDLNHIDSCDLPYVRILSNLLGTVNTKSYKYTDLDSKIALSSGGFSYNPNVYTKIDDTVDLRFEVFAKTLDLEANDWTKVLAEILLSSDFKDEKRILEVLNMEASNEYESIVGNGNRYASLRLSSRLNETGYVNEQLKGVSYYQVLKNIVDNFSSEKDALIEKLSEISKVIFNKNNLLITVGAEEKAIKEFKNNAEVFVDNLFEDVYTPAKRELGQRRYNEAIKIDSNVNYVVKGGSFEKYKENYEGDMVVMTSMISSDYMHNMIRAKGGAYGNALKMNKLKEVIASSYRDPNIKYTLDIYDTLGDHLKNLEIPKKSLDEYIIGAINHFNPVLNPTGLTYLANVEHLTGETYEDRKRDLESALNTDLEKMQKYGEVLANTINNGNYVVIGNAEAIENNKELFDEIINI